MIAQCQLQKFESDRVYLNEDIKNCIKTLSTSLNFLETNDQNFASYFTPEGIFFLLPAKLYKRTYCATAYSHREKLKVSKKKTMEKFYIQNFLKFNLSV